MKCGVHEELCELSGEARIEELRRVVRGVVAAHLSGVGDAFEMRLVPEGISLDDDESVAHLSAGGCVEVVPQVPLQELAKRDIPLDWYSIVTATFSKSYDVVGWLLQAGVNTEDIREVCDLTVRSLQDTTVLNLIVDHDILLSERVLTLCNWRWGGTMTTLVDATLARGSDRFKNHLLKALLAPVYWHAQFSGGVGGRAYDPEAVPHCETLIPVSPLDGTVTALCGERLVRSAQYTNLLPMLLEHGAAVDRDVLLEAHQGIPLETLQLLVQKGADPNARLRRGYEVRDEMLNMEESLVACGMDIDTVCSHRNNTVLTRKVQKINQHEHVAKLVSLGANPNIFDDCGDTLTMHVAKKRHWLNLQALLQSDRLDINQKSDNGQTVLMYIAGKATLCGLEMVFEATPDLEVEDTKGWTCLAHAASSRKVSAVKLLLEHGAKVDGGATTALEQAVVEGSLDVCKVLLDNGADPLHMTSGGMTCLALAESCSEETASLLRGRLAKTPPGQESRGVKRKREELEVEEATETAEEEQGSEEEEEDATEHSCRECGVAQTAAGVPFASEASVRRHVSSKHRMKWSDYLARYEE